MLPLQVNVVVMRGSNDDEVPDFVELTRERPLNVRFIEYMPFDGNVWSDRKMVPYRELIEAVERRFPEGLVRLQVRRLKPRKPKSLNPALPRGPRPLAGAPPKALKP